MDRNLRYEIEGVDGVQRFGSDGVQRFGSYAKNAIQ